MGLAGSIPLILQKYHITYTDQAIFAFVSWPYSVKLLWAPIVDSIFSKKYGRRKSWIIPIQIIVGLILILYSYKIESLLINDNGPYIYTLTFLFFVLYFLVATQDIAVDGLAISILRPENKGYASTTNSIGQTVGYFFSYAVFLAFNNPDFCDYFRKVPTHEPFMDLSKFMFLCGVLFVVVTICISGMKEPDDYDDIPSVKESYSEIFSVIKLKNVLLLSFVLVTFRLGFCVTEDAFLLRLIDKGVPEFHVAMVGVLYFPVEICIII